ncbi:hypothetical protein [Paludibacterium sp. B53371]|uniref:hypothetical protein n=1 Tax=Paludibacterium sp. B53371 TaxID=2806263 RepID=UPI001C0543B9|nr:hypothetical protein [Paludibacterium sp. B53371]
MIDDPIGPVQPVQGVRALTPVSVPRHPGYGALRTWLAFSRRLSARKARQRSGASAPAGSEVDATSCAADQGHLDDYA